MDMIVADELEMHATWKQVLVLSSVLFQLSRLVGFRAIPITSQFETRPNWFQFAINGNELQLICIDAL